MDLQTRNKHKKHENLKFEMFNVDETMHNSIKLKLMTRVNWFMYD